MKPLRCPLCVDNIRQEIVIAFNGLHPTKERQREVEEAEFDIPDEEEEFDAEDFDLTDDAEDGDDED